MNQVAQRIGAAMYQNAGSEQKGEKAGEGKEGKKGDEPVEGEVVNEKK